MTRLPKNVSSLDSARTIRRIQNLAGLTQTTCDTEYESCKVGDARGVSVLSPSGKARIWAKIQEAMNEAD